VNLALASLSLRRSLPWPLIALAGLVALILARGAAALAPVLPVGGGVERALAREGMWTGMLAVLLPLFVLRQAGTLARWRRGEADWLACARHGQVLVSAWSGAFAGGLLVLLFAALCAELTAGSGRAGLRIEAQLPAPRVVLVGGRGAQRWRVEGADGELGQGSLLRARVVLVAGAPAAEVRFSARRAEADGATTTVRRRISGRGSVLLDVPSGSGPLELELEREEPAAIVALEGDGVELVRPVASERAASAAILARAALALAAWLALALGLGAWLSSPTAALFLLALALPVWLAAGDPHAALRGAWPWSGLPEAIEVAGQGFAPPLPTARALATTVLAVAAGLGLARAGLRDWRRDA
jgi:hypothetical protein